MLMTRLPRIKAWQQALILAVVVQFFGAVTMTAFPWLHERLHHDAGSGHQCAVTVLLTGASDGSPVPPAVASGNVPAIPVYLSGRNRISRDLANFSYRSRLRARPTDSCLIQRWPVGCPTCSLADSAGELRAAAGWSF